MENLLLELKKGEIYGFIGLNGSGNTATIRMMLGMIKPNDGALMGNPNLAQIFRRLLQTKKGDRKIIAGAASYEAEDLRYLNGLIADSRIRPIIDRIFPLDELSEAHRYVESGVKKGNVVISNQ